VEAAAQRIAGAISFSHRSIWARSRDRPRGQRRSTRTRKPSSVSGG
jgi:hypothetical protein